MKKILVVVGALALLIVVGVGAYLAHLVRSLDTPEFKEAMLARARTTLGTDVQVKDLRVSLLSGVTLEGVTVANPAPFAGNLLTAKSFVLRYRLRPLLAGRFEIDDLVLSEPTVHLAMDARERFNYELLGGASPTPSDTTPTAGPKALPLEVELRNLAMEDASIEMRDHRKALLTRIEKASFRSRFSLTKTGMQGTGTATIGTVNLGDVLFIRAFSAPLEVSKESLRLTPIEGKIAGGSAGGDVTVDLKDFRFKATLDVRKVDVATLLKEAGSSQAVTGTLGAKATFEGSGGLPTLVGQGRAEITGCKAANTRTLALLSKVLKLPELANPDFDECLVEFRLERSRLHTPVLRLTGKQIQIAGKGSMNMETSALDYNLTLALAAPLLNKITVPELRSAFVDRGDGFSTLAFDLTGTTLEPRTNLASKMAKAAAKEAAVSGLGRLFGKKKK